jgi:hypothetical protein
MPPSSGPVSTPASGYEFLVQVSPAVEAVVSGPAGPTHDAATRLSRSPVFRNRACCPSVPLAAQYKGMRTLCETFETTCMRAPDHPFLGHRLVPQEGKPTGPYQFMSFR